jgi:coproporphyrinogen III oxidase-like Fe-S oxidoreductase
MSGTVTLAAALADLAERLVESGQVRAWSAVAGAPWDTVRLEREAHAVLLSARPIDELPSWHATGAVAFNVRCEVDPAPSSVHAFLEELRPRLDELAPPRTPPRRSGIEQRLHRAAFLAHQVLRHDPRILPVIERHDGESTSSWRTLIMQEYYPYPGALGDRTSAEEIAEGWSRTVANIRAGRAPRHTGIYVHVPYCAMRCRFCYCSMTETVARPDVSAYVDHLCRELERYGALLDGTPITSVFIGGGTPSLLPTADLSRLFAAMHASFDIPDSTQITMETNPDSLTPGKVALLATEGRVKRLTLGIQSIDPDTQHRANRFNRPEKIRELARAIHDAGLILHTDVMAGMDGQTFEAFQRDVEFALSIEPDSLHLSPFRPVSLDGHADPEQVERRRRMQAWGDERLEQRGLRALLGFPRSARHEAINAQLVEWREEASSLVPIGVSAYGNSFAGHGYENSAHAGMAEVDAALVQLRRQGQPMMRAVAMDEAEEAHRYLIHMLLEGFSVAKFRAMFGMAPRELAPEAWDDLIELGALSVDGDAVSSHIDNQADKCILGAMLYGPRVVEAIERRWGQAYDASTNYAAWIHAISNGSS